MSGLPLDLRFALRSLARRPGFTAVALLILTVALGATTAVFSLVYGVLLEPLALPDAARVVMVFEDHAARGGSPREVTGLTTLGDLRTASAGAFAAFAGAINDDAMQVAVVIDGEAEAVTANAVSAGYFQVLGTPPAPGREFTRAEEVSGDDGAVILSHGLWQRRFGGDRDILGRSLQVAGEPRTVVGVAPPGLVDPLSPRADLWIPLAGEPGEDDRGAYYVRMLARLAPGATAERAKSQLAATMAGIAERHPDLYHDVAVAVAPLRDVLVGGVRTPLAALFAAVLLVLLIACVNLANLLLARGAGRGREIAVRAALGAGRARLARQLLTETLLLTLGGGLLGLLAGGQILDFLVAIAPPGTPRLGEAQLAAPVFLFAFGVTLLVGIAVGLLPSWKASRADLALPLRQGRGTVAASVRLRSGLIVAEVALSLALLVGAGLLMRSLLRLAEVDPGFAAERLVAAQVSFPTTSYPEGSDVRRGVAEIASRLGALPGIESAAATSVLPLTNNVSDAGVTVPGRPPRDDDPRWVQIHAVSPGYFATFGIPRLAGRDFARGDAAESPLVVAVNAAFARQYFDGADAVAAAVGRELQLGSSGEPRRIVGVVGSVHHLDLAAPLQPQVYLPHDQVTTRGVHFVLRTADDTVPALATLQGVIRQVDAEMPVMALRTGDDLLRGQLAMPRFLASILGAFAGVALFLAAVGLYGLMAFLVTERRREIGLRLALGARPRSVLAMVLRQGLGLAVAGTLAGVALALALARGLASLLYGVRPADPWSLFAAALVLLAAATLACLAPGLRAARVDPVISLRQE